MKTSRIMLLSVFISITILVIIGGVASTVMARQTTDQNVLQTYQQREEEYQRLIDEANQKIEKANKELQSMQEQVAAPQEEVVSAPTSSMITPNQADEVARQASGEGHSKIKEPELVNYDGKMAYEVTFDNGSIYVDAINSEVLFNGTIPVTIDQTTANQIAADYFHEESEVVLSDQISFRGEKLFRVVFKDSLMVYVDSTGQITYAQYATMKSQTGSSEDAGSSSAAAPQTGSHENEYENENENDH